VPSQEENAPRLKEVEVRVRLIAPVLLVLVATACAFVVIRMVSSADAWLVLAVGLGVAAVTATLISDAETRRSRSLLTDEQDALRRLALLVARESSPVEIFGAVTEEARRVLQSEAVGLLRFEPDGTAVLVAQSDTPWDPPPLGTRLPLDGENVVTEVIRTGEGARVDDWSGASGAVAAMATALGVRSAVSSPVVVERRLWGTIVVVTSRSEPLPAETESRVAQFTGLVATAIANAEARGALSRLAEEQAALRRVAVLVAQQTPPNEVFAGLPEAIGPLLGADVAALYVFDGDDTARVIATWTQSGPELRIGTQLPLDGDSAVARIFRTRAAARIDGYASADDETAEFARGLHLRSAVGAPIVVEGKLWGALTAATRREEPLPGDAEARIAAFTELVATAVSNAQAREQITALAEEQAALRRVAELVAEESALADVLAGVAGELGNVLGDVEWALARDDGDGMATALAVSDHNPTPAGTRVKIDTGSAFGRAIRDGSPARIDDYFATPGEIARTAREHGVRAAVSCPIVVRNRTWGAMSVGWRNPDPFPPGTESVVARFSDLVATAIANAEARAQIERLADEQAALRRIATLVAGGAAPEQVFAAVTDEIAATFDAVTAVMRFEHDPPSQVVVGLSEGGGFPLGTRWPLSDGMLSTEVYRTGRPIRIGALLSIRRAVARLDAARHDVPVEGSRLGVPAQVACPIVVEGSLWGVITLNAERELPSDTEQRLANFIELVTTAIANAEAGIALREAADEQGALRRVATLVAADPQPGELFRAVALEIGTLLGADFSGLARLANGDVFPLAGWAAEGEHPPLPDRWPMSPGDPVAEIAEARHSVRRDDWTEVAGPIAAFIRDELGVRSSVGTPIFVEGRLWGVLAVHSRQSLPKDSVPRLEQFSDLVATALANADAHAEVARLADEQAALRRIATLVAQGVEPEQVFAAVTEETVAAFHAITVVMRFEHDPPANVIVGISKETGIPIGTRWPLAEGMASTIVYRTRRPARVGNLDWSEHPDATVAKAADHFGVTVQVACPIIVEGSLWGVVALSAGEELPPDTEERLEKFTELVTTAIANAEAGIAVRAAADEQGALRRVATLVAASAVPSAVFAAVTKEIALVLGADATLLCRADPDGIAVVVGTWTSGASAPALGTRIPRGGTNLITTVLEAGRPARVESYDDASGAASEVARTHGLRSAVGTPILVEGRIWGLVVAGTTSDEALPPDAEERLAGFTELVGTAIANAQAQGDLATLAEQQAALRRVATLVAQRVAPDVVFRAVAEEAGGLLRADIAALVRLESDDTATVVAVPPLGPYEPGERVTIDPDYVVETVRRTGRPARFETDDPSAEGMPEVVRRLGVRSAVASPIVVERELWGAVVLGSIAESFPPETEQRLDEFTELVATAISNATARAELVASRARIVAAGDEARRRIERNLHDGTQQRLVSLGLALRVAEANLPPERDDLRAQLSGVATGLVAAVEDLQEISRGIHPAILSKGGLAPALRTLAHRSGIPVDLDIAADMRLAEPIEVAAYFVASEALANAAKHSQASRIDVSLEQLDGRLTLSVRDDGVGGADAARGSGLIGLADRVEALGGSLRVSSRPGEGTQITAELPLELELTPVAS
jgi:GAF domain-containing protein